MFSHLFTIGIEKGLEIDYIGVSNQSHDLQFSVLRH